MTPKAKTPASMTAKDKNMEPKKPPTLSQAMPGFIIIFVIVCVIAWFATTDSRAKQEKRIREQDNKQGYRTSDAVEPDWGR
jgi:hypothetical protein